MRSGIGEDVIGANRAPLEAARRQLQQTWTSHAAGGGALGLRACIARSWERCDRHVERDIERAPLIAADRAAERWRASPLRDAVRSLTNDVDRIVGDGDMIAGITGADGTILWTRGSRWMRDRAAQVHFVRAGRWDEASMGTNAMAVALATNEPARVFSAEHWSSAVHDWVCYSAPIRDRGSGRILGVLDLSTTYDRAHPLGLSIASLLARNLSLLVPAGATVDEEEGLCLRTLGGARVSMDGRDLSLSPRQVEILVVLSLHPEGLSLDALHAALYEDLRVKPATVKAEVSHLRRRLGDVIGSRPYVLDVQWEADHVRLVEHLRAGRLTRAVELYAGPMLPASEAPAVRRHATFVETALRRAVLDAGDPDLLFALGDRFGYDAELHEQTLHRLEQGDPRRAIVHARIAAGDA